MKYDYICRDMSGRYRWEAEASVKRLREDVYLFVEEGHGIYSSFDGPVSWTTRMMFVDDGTDVFPLELEKRVFNENGDVIRFEKQEYDPDNDRVKCVHKEYPGSLVRRRTFELDRDVVNRQLLGFYARNFLEKGAKRRKVHMISEEPARYNVEIRVEGKENIEFNGGRTEAYKLRIDPQLGVFNFAKIFFPGSFIWHSAGPDARWLAYEGLEGDLTSEKVRITVLDRSGNN
ncbi:MAG: hypothetical protein GF392_05065 [Candidatus Omnitrophica bacterium]|nr:hypothetical protein [Candidatus Omnitrophota bacterium]